MRLLLLVALITGCSVEVSVAAFEEAARSSCPDGWVMVRTWKPGQSIQFLCKNGVWGPIK